MKSLQNTKSILSLTCLSQCQPRHCRRHRRHQTSWRTCRLQIWCTLAERWKTSQSCTFPGKTRWRTNLKCENQKFLWVLCQPKRTNFTRTRMKTKATPLSHPHFTKFVSPVCVNRKVAKSRRSNEWLSGRTRTRTLLAPNWKKGFSWTSPAVLLHVITTGTNRRTKEPQGNQYSLAKQRPSCHMTPETICSSTRIASPTWIGSEEGGTTTMTTMTMAEKWKTSEKPHRIVQRLQNPIWPMDTNCRGAAESERKFDLFSKTNSSAYTTQTLNEELPSFSFLCIHSQTGNEKSHNFDSSEQDVVSLYVPECTVDAAISLASWNVK